MIMRQVKFADFFVEDVTPGSGYYKILLVFYRKP